MSLPNPNSSFVHGGELANRRGIHDLASSVIVYIHSSQVRIMLKTRFSFSFSLIRVRALQSTTVTTSVRNQCIPNIKLMHTLIQATRKLFMILWSKMVIGDYYLFTNMHLPFMATPVPMMAPKFFFFEIDNLSFLTTRYETKLWVCQNRSWSHFFIWLTLWFFSWSNLRSWPKCLACVYQINHLINPTSVIISLVCLSDPSRCLSWSVLPSFRR